MNRCRQLIGFRLNLPAVRNGVGVQFFEKFHTLPALRAGHSKWANIKHTKALKDGQKAAAFIKLSRQIRLAIQDGGSSNPAINTALKTAVEQAIRKNMPMGTIQNVIKKSEQAKTQLRKHVLGIKTLKKVYMMCVVYTDNLAGMKMILAPIVRKAGATFVDEPHLFEEHGIIEARPEQKILEMVKSENDLDELCTEAAIECGAEEVEVVDIKTGLVNFICRPEELDNVTKSLSGKGYIVENSEHIFLPKVPISVPESDLKLYETFCNKLKAVDGIEEIHDNLQPPEG